MYVQHFGFSRPLFGDGVAQDENIFRTPATDSLKQDLAMALARRDSVALITGQSGTGKTTLALDALKRVSTRLAFAAINQPPASENELLEQLLTELGLEVSGTSRIERLQLWRQYLSEMTATDTRVCLLIEDIEDLEEELLRTLHRLTAADASLSAGANVILTSTQPAASLLTSPELTAFGQRVRLRRRIEPLTQAETADYIEFRFRHADCEATGILAPGAAAEIHALSGGIMRLIDGFLESALIAAAAQGRAQLDPDLIAAVAESQFGIAPLGPVEVAAILEESASAAMTETSDSSDIPTLTDSLDESEPPAGRKTPRRLFAFR